MTMSRKRFIKLLMSRGVSRNEANELAETATAYGYNNNYKDYFEFACKHLHQANPIRIDGVAYEA